MAAEALERLGIDVLQSARNENSAMNVLFDNAVVSYLHLKKVVVRQEVVYPIYPV